MLLARRAVPSLSPGGFCSVMTEPQPTNNAAASPRRSWVRWQVVLILMGFTGLNHFHGRDSLGLARAGLGLSDGTNECADLRDARQRCVIVHCHASRRGGGCGWIILSGPC